MKVDFDRKFLDINGKNAIKDNDGKEMSMKDVIIRDILTPLKEDDKEFKYNDYLIWEKVISDKDLTVEELARIKEKTGQLEAPLILGQIWKIIDESK